MKLTGTYIRIIFGIASVLIGRPSTLDRYCPGYGCRQSGERLKSLFSNCIFFALILVVATPLSAQVAPPTPLLSLQDALVFEDGSVTLNFSASSNVLSVTAVETTVVLAGIPDGWGVDSNGGVFDAATGTWTTALAPGQTLTEGPILSPPADSDADILFIAANVTSTDLASGLSSSTSGSIAVTTDAVADVPTLATQDVISFSDTAIFDIFTASTDIDGSEAISQVVFRDVPDGFTLSNGTDNDDGTFTLSQSDLLGLEIIAPGDFGDGSFVLDVVSFSTESNLTDTDFDFTNNTASASSPLAVTFATASVPEPTTGLLLSALAAGFMLPRRRERI